jgi:hypothetical protein
MGEPKSLRRKSQEQSQEQPPGQSPRASGGIPRGNSQEKSPRIWELSNFSEWRESLSWTQLYWGKRLYLSPRRIDWAPVKLSKQAALMGGCSQRQTYTFIEPYCRFLLRHRYWIAKPGLGARWLDRSWKLGHAIE